MKTETQQLLDIYTVLNKVPSLDNLTTKRGKKMKTIKIENENITLEEFKNKWGWTIGQFRRLATFNDFATYKANFDNLESIANEMIENAFNEQYTKQNKGEE